MTKKSIKSGVHRGHLKGKPPRRRWNPRNTAAPAQSYPAWASSPVLPILRWCCPAAALASLS